MLALFRFRFRRTPGAIFTLLRKRNPIKNTSLSIKVYSPALRPVVQGFFYVVFVQVKIFCQLPRLCVAFPHSCTDFFRRQTAAKRVRIRAVFVLLHQLERAVYLMQCAGTQVARFMQHCGAHLAHGMQTLEIQHNGIILTIPHGTGRPRQHCERHNIHIILFAISVKVGQLKHWIYSSCFFLARRSRITLTISRSTALSSSESSLYSP
nr:MAG TPA: hypothetical protein [Caudoviricetes sp.]